MRTAGIFPTFWVIALLSTVADGAQILGIFAHPGKSHYDFFRPLFLGLAAAGHNTTVVSYYPNKVPVANYTDMALSGMPLIVDLIDLNNFERKPSSQQILPPFNVPTFFMLHDWGLQSCAAAFESPSIKQLLENDVGRFDVIILEQFNNDCMLAVAHVLQAPVVALSSCALLPWHFQRMGSPFIPSHMPTNFLPYNDEMDFWSRFNNFLHFYSTNILYNYLTQRATNALVQQYLGDYVPPVEQLLNQISLILINQHFSFTLPYPYAPSIVEVGGLQILKAQPLPLVSAVHPLSQNLPESLHTHEINNSIYLLVLDLRNLFDLVDFPVNLGQRMYECKNVDFVI